MSFFCVIYSFKISVLSVIFFVWRKRPWGICSDWWWRTDWLSWL